MKLKKMFAKKRKKKERVDLKNVWIFGK